MSGSAEHIKWFRDSTPYIDGPPGKTFVFCLDGHVLGSGNLPNILSDLALLRSLGVRLVLAYGDEKRIDAVLQQNDLPRAEGPRSTITTAGQMKWITGISGDTEALLSAGFAATAVDSPARRQDIPVVSGNFIRARPIGIVDGIDHEQSGEVRNVNQELIRHLLDRDTIVLVPSLGYSPSGETFALDPASVAMEVACALSADKLIFMTATAGILDDAGELISEIDLSAQGQELPALDPRTEQLLGLCNTACHRGVARCHLVSHEADGAILEELFTRDGCGTQVVGHSYEQVRAATTDDVPGILKLIAPLEEAGVLVRRSRELIESEIDRFVVIERDGLLISCAALYQFDETGELACLVTHPDYRKGDRAERLLDCIVRKARESKLTTLFVLTTQSADWFRERGFDPASMDDLPAGRKHFYNYQRNSSVLIRQL